MGVLYDLAKWDGAAWTFEIVQGGKYSAVSAFHEFDGKLYAAGMVAGFAGEKHWVAELDLGTWTPIGGFAGLIHTITDFNGEIVIGGEFEQTLLGEPMSHVAKWDGIDSWTQVGAGLDNTVRVLKSHNNLLYAGGDFASMNDSSTFSLASFDNSQWQQMMDPTYYMPVTGANGYISSIAFHGNDMYVGGQFDIYPFVGTIGHNIGRIEFDGTSEYFIVANAAFDAAVNDIVVVNDRLYAGGQFQMVNWGIPISHVAYLDLVITGIEPPVLTNGGMTHFPNPMMESAFIKFDAPKENVALELFSTNGQKVQVDYSVNQEGIELKRGNLAIGTYFYTVTQKNDLIGNGKLVVQ
jgi:hypothetical protein